MLRKSVSSMELVRKLKEIEEKNKKISENIENEIKNYTKKIKNAQNTEELENIENEIRLLELKKNKDKYNKKIELQWKLEDLKEDKKRNRRKKRKLWLISIIGFFLLGITFFVKNYIPTELLISIRIVSFSYFLLGAILYFYQEDSFITEEIKEVMDELDYLNSENQIEEIKAEKRFRIYQNELQKYYSQNLSHSKNLFRTGIISIFLGFLVIAYTLIFLSINNESSNATQIIITGGIGGVLSNFIGAIYLKMYSETLKVLSEFHSKLVYTQNLHFSNCLLAKIENKELKEKVLQDAILAIVKRETLN